MRKSRVPGEGTYSTRHNRKKSSSSEDHETSGVINKFRDLAEIPDVDGVDVDYGMGGLEEYNEHGASNDVAEATHEEDNQFHYGDRSHPEHRMYGENGVEWDELSEEGNDDAELPQLQESSLKSDENHEELQILAYSRKPRQVDFKPYTLTQYKQIKPKEYVEFSKLQPGAATHS